MPIKITKKAASSNKTQTVGKIASEELGKPPADTLLKNQLRPFIDKISLILEPASDEDAYDFHSSIWASFDDKTVFQSAGPGALKGWRRAQLISLKATTHRPLFQYTWEEGTPAKARRFRLDCNPRKLGAQGLLELHSVLGTIWHNGWDYVVKHARITRIDVAVDLPGIRIDEVLFIPKQGASEIQWGRDGHLQSFRHGQPQGNQTLVYSVKQKRLAKKQPWSGPSVVRIERRLRNPSPAKLPKLAALKNPFTDMALTTMPGPPPDEGAPSKARMWSVFEDSVKARGVRAALALVPKNRRAKYRAHLKQHPKPWWNPKAIWEKWPDVLDELKITSADWH